MTGPADLRTRFAQLTAASLVTELAALRPRPGEVVGYATRIALRELRRRAEFPGGQLGRPGELIVPLATARAPALLAPHGVGPDTAAILLSAGIAALDSRIDAEIGPFAAAIQKLDEVPGISLAAAHAILAGTGPGMTRLPTAGHLVSWAKYAPLVKESAGKKKGRNSTGHGNPYLARILGNAAAAAGSTGTFPRRALPAHRPPPRRPKGPTSPSADPSWSSSGTCCPTKKPDSAISDQASTPPASTPNAASKATSASSRPSATKSPSNPPPDPPPKPARLRCAPPGAAARPLTLRFSD